MSKTIIAGNPHPSNRPGSQPQRNKVPNQTASQASKSRLCADISAGLMANCSNRFKVDPDSESVHCHTQPRPQSQKDRGIPAIVPVPSASFVYSPNLIPFPIGTVPAKLAANGLSSYTPSSSSPLCSSPSPAYPMKARSYLFNSTCTDKDLPTVVHLAFGQRYDSTYEAGTNTPGFRYYNHYSPDQRCHSCTSQINNHRYCKPQEFESTEGRADYPGTQDRS